MPIPTDTFWNIRRLNKIFAVSAVLMLAFTGWAVIQDYDKEWRRPQREGRVWDAALVDQRLQREFTDEQRARVAELRQQLEARETAIERQDERFRAISSEIRQLENERARLEFSINDLNADLGVLESQLEDAITAGDRRRQRNLAARMERPRALQAEQVEQFAAVETQLVERRAELAERRADIDELRRELAMMTQDVELLERRLEALQPRSAAARFSAWLRRRPLLQFVNPMENVRQVVLPDVRTDMMFMHVTTIDRCHTCHVNIDRPEFAAENVMAYLEEQVAVKRQFVLPDQPPGARAADPQATADQPGPVAMVDFWHAWTRALVPELITRNNIRIRTLAGTVGGDNPAQVTWDGQPLESFTYDVGETDPEAIAYQDAILVELIRAWYRFQRPQDPAQPGALSQGRNVRVEIRGDAPDRTVTQARNAALKYPEIFRDGLREHLPPEMHRQLEDRYRHAMVAEVNQRRRELGLEPLDPSPVLLAHPNLDLYVDIDSPHSFESVGCTSCHDGSGQETNFVLAAHTSRPIWVDDGTGEPVLPQQLLAPPAPPVRTDLSSMFLAVYPPDLPIPAPLDAFHLADVRQENDAQGEGADQLVTEAPYNAPPARYVDPHSGRTGRAVPQIRYWGRKYEQEAGTDFAGIHHRWDFPMRRLEYVQANCVRCHTDVHDIREHAPVLYEGRSLFTTMGCVNCHAVDTIPAHEKPKVGPDLRHVAAKLSPDFLHTWIWAPKAFRPSTQMPHFFMLENNSSDEEIRRTRQEVRAMTEYLVQTSTPFEPKHEIPQGLAGTVDAGRVAFNSLGCIGCHTNLNEVGEEWIALDLEKRAGMSSTEAREAFAAMSYNQRQLYVHEHLAEEAARGELPDYGDGTAQRPPTPRPVFVNHGPELSAIGTKLLAGRSPEQARAWLFDWLKDPRHYSDYTAMPDLRLSDQEAIDLAEYLLAQQRTTADPEDGWRAGLPEIDPPKLRELTAFLLRTRFSPRMAFERAADPQEMLDLATDALTTPVTPRQEARRRAEAMSLEEQQMMFLGKRMISHYGCMSCHAINGLEDAASPGADLSDWGGKNVAMLDFSYLDAHKLEELPPTHAIDMINAMSVEAANLGHTLPDAGWAGRISRPVEAAWPKVDHDRESWLFQKVRNSRAYDRGKALLEPQRQLDAQGNPVVLDDQGRPVLADAGRPYDKLLMPTFYFNDEQIRSIVTFVLSNRERLISDGLTARATDETARRIALGRVLADHYNCVGCHQVEANQPPVQQYYDPDQWGTDAPPSLRGQGNKVQHAWLFNFLKNVEPIRPVPVIRMPSFPLTDEEATALASYFSAVSVKESQQLRALVAPVLRYVAAEGEAAGEPAEGEFQPDQPRPGDDWYTRPEFTGAAEVLREWALRNRQITPIELDPAFNTPDQLAVAHRTILFKAQFTANLFDAPYPFVDQPRAAVSEERFALGQEFFFEMACLECHVLGDPAAPGAHLNPSAPNLSLVQQRLQRRWVRHWVQEPPIIQPGTPMPSFFTGLPVHSLPGQPYHLAVIPEHQMEDRQRIAEQYGQTVDEQTNLLLDFLYAASARNLTVVQPPVTDEPAETPAGTEEQPQDPQDEPEPQPATEQQPAAESPEAPAG